MNLLIKSIFKKINNSNKSILVIVLSCQLMHTVLVFYNYFYYLYLLKYREKLEKKRKKDSIHSTKSKNVEDRSLPLSSASHQ